MRKEYIYLILILLFSPQLTAQTGLNDFDLSDVHALDQNNIVISSYTGDIFCLKFNGSAWNTEKADIPVITSWYSLDFVDSSNGWVCGNDGKILRTADGGKTWYETPTGTHERLNEIQLYSKNIGWAVGSNGTVLKTMFGDDWSEVGFPNDLFLGNVIIMDFNTVYVTSRFELYITRDGGETWEVDITHNGAPKIPLLPDVYFLDEMNGWAGSWGHGLYRTIDGGSSWSIAEEEIFPSLSYLQFMDENTGFALDVWRGRLNSTTDGGNSWHAVAGTENLRSLSFLDNSIAYAVGDSGTFYMTTNGGNSWTAQRVLYEDKIELIFENIFDIFPNPFNNFTVLRFVVPEGNTVSFKVYNLLGQEIYSNSTSVFPNIQQLLNWDGIDNNGRPLASGVYLCKISSGNYSAARKITILR